MTTLFPLTQPSLDWSTFPADGFSGRITGVVYREDRPAKNGMPLGGLDTGCLDLETNGLLGYMSLFNSLMPRRGPLSVPFLGFKVAGHTYVCAATSMPGVTPAKEVHYWGHYPVADVEFVMDSPIQIGLRAWSPFIPGDTTNSMIPSAVFEVRVRNTAETAKRVTVAMTFPGFDRSEALFAKIVRADVQGPVQGMLVRSAGGFGPYTPEKQSPVQYLLGRIGDHPVRPGAHFGWNPEKWQQMDTNCPPLSEEHDSSGISVATDVTLVPGEEQTLRFVLAWHAPTWCAGGTPTSGGNVYRHMYARHFADATAVAEYVTAHHTDLLRRILAWQEAVYREDTLPGWLQDCLVNVLHLLTEDSVWAQAEPPVGDWCRAEDGIFAMNECPRSCPQLECIPCSFYGNLPLVYFFPEAALSTLRTYNTYQFETGQAPWVFGGVTGLTGPYEITAPVGGYQWALDGSCLVEMVDKYWRITGDDAVLREFYAMCKRVTDFTMTRRPAYGIKQVVSMPEGNLTQDWFEFAPFYGLVSHIGGVHLAHLRIMQRMAETMGDTLYAQQCADLRAGGAQALETDLWLGTHYRMYFEPESGKVSDMVMAYQLDGQWIARFHGVGSVFPEDRVHITLDTIARINANSLVNPHGAVVFVNSDGRRPRDTETGYWTGYGTHAPGNYMLAMTDIMHGHRERGLELLQRTLRAQTLLLRGQWDAAILYRADTGDRMFGNDYYQNMMLWSVPAVLAGQDLAGPCREGGLVANILRPPYRATP